MKKLYPFLLIGLIIIFVIVYSWPHTKLLAVLNNKTELLTEITEKAHDYYVPPIDAKIDPVWKAIPGYNGLEVDIKASYQKMKKLNQFDEKKLVFKQVEPKVHLKDLPPAPIYKGNPSKPMVSFVINVAWGNEYISDILATLKKHNIRASFFLEGRWVQKNPELAQMIVAAGHEVGNHSYTHPNMKIITSAKIREEIVKTNDVIKATTDAPLYWLAPPSGSYREEVVKIAAEEKLGTIMWSVDTIDWQKPAPNVLLDRVMGNIHNGALILMHPTDPTAKSLDKLITEIKKKKLEINTVSELLNENRVMH